MGATLATVDNSLQDDAITELCGDNDCYIGLNDISADGSFVWEADGSALETYSYTNWYANNPKSHAIQNCVIKRASQNGQWDDVGCSKTSVSYVFRMEAEETCDTTDPEYGTTVPEYDTTVPEYGSGCESTSTCSNAEFTFIDNSCFYVSADYLTWADASSACKAMGATIATVDDSLQDDAITELCGINNCYIGLNDISAEGSFVWQVDGSALETYSYTNWYANNPTFNTVQNCVMKKASQNGQWDDVGCSKTTYTYVCRMEAEETCGTTFFEYGTTVPDYGTTVPDYGTTVPEYGTTVPEYDSGCESNSTCSNDDY